MTKKIDFGWISGGYLLAIVALCFGNYCRIIIGGDMGLNLGRIAFLAAVLIVMRTTFEWGRLRGLLIIDGDGGLSFRAIFRNLAMSALAFVVLVLVSAPLLALSYKFAI